MRLCVRAAQLSDWRIVRKIKTKVAGTRRALLKIDGQTVEIVLRINPRARRYIVKVDPSSGEVSVVAPSSRSLERALAFARKERDWIAEQLADILPPVPLEFGAPVMLHGIEHVVRPSEGGESDGGRGPVWIDDAAIHPTIRVRGRPEHAPRRVLDWLKRRARKRIDERVCEYARTLGVRPKRVTIRDTSSRWGSCSSERNLSFSWRLILAPPFVLDYVVAHEIAHLRELNHEPRFWRLVATLVPGTDEAQNWLSEKGAMLHRYVPRRHAIA